MQTRSLPKIAREKWIGWNLFVRVAERRGQRVQEHFANDLDDDLDQELEEEVDEKSLGVCPIVLSRTA